MKYAIGSLIILGVYNTRIINPLQKMVLYALVASVVYYL